MMNNDDAPVSSDGGDHEALMDHCALECMNALEMKDKEGFRDAFHVLVADILNKLSDEMESKED